MIEFNGLEGWVVDSPSEKRELLATGKAFSGDITIRTTRPALARAVIMESRQESGFGLAGSSIISCAVAMLVMMIYFYNSGGVL